MLQRQPHGDTGVNHAPAQSQPQRLARAHTARCLPVQAPRVPVQVGAHGTGASVPPMDEQVVALTLVTPGRGTLHLSQDDPEPCVPPSLLPRQIRGPGITPTVQLSRVRILRQAQLVLQAAPDQAWCSMTRGTRHCRSLFYMARVGLGSLGVISEVTLQTVPAQQLLEHTFVSNMQARLPVRGRAAAVHASAAKSMTPLGGSHGLRSSTTAAGGQAEACKVAAGQPAPAVHVDPAH